VMGVSQDLKPNYTTFNHSHYLKGEIYTF